MSDGLLPATIGGLPAGNYKVIATHHGHERPDTLTVKADTTTDAPSDFEYGKARFETSPAGVTVETEDSRNWGETPLTLREMLPGNWQFILQRSGYQSMKVSLECGSQSDEQCQHQSGQRNISARLECRPSIYGRCGLRPGFSGGGRCPSCQARRP